MSEKDENRDVPAPITHATAQGRRSHQQDRCVIANLDSGWLLAVMDGHGGEETAVHLAFNLTRTLETSLKSNRDSLPTALKETAASLAKRTEQEASGSTLSVVFIPKDRSAAHVAVIGDSPVIIRDAQGALSISPLHNARVNLKERAAAAAKGARFVEGYLEDPHVPGEGLQMSRALGDRKLARILSREPDIYSVALGGNSVVIVATDGVLSSRVDDWENQLERLAELAHQGGDAEQLVQDALERQTGDNVTVIVWKSSG